MGQPGEPYDPNPSYPPPGYPPNYPGYPTNYPQGQQPGYPAPGQYGAGNYAYGPQYPYPYGYPPPPGSARPGNATAAAVLGYITAGLLIAAGLLLLLGASVIDDFDRNSGGSHSLATAELVFDGILNLVAAGLLIAGGVSFTGRSTNGRVMLSVGCGIVIGESVYWLLRSDTASGAVFWALVYAALVVIAVSLAWTKIVGSWLRTSA